MTNINIARSFHVQTPEQYAENPWFVQNLRKIFKRYHQHLNHSLTEDTFVHVAQLALVISLPRMVPLRHPLAAPVIISNYYHIINNIEGYVNSNKTQHPFVERVSDYVAGTRSHYLRLTSLNSDITAYGFTVDGDGYLIRTDLTSRWTGEPELASSLHNVYQQDYPVFNTYSKGHATPPCMTFNYDIRQVVNELMGSFAVKHPHTTDINRSQLQNISIRITTRINKMVSIYTSQLIKAFYTETLDPEIVKMCKQSMLFTCSDYNMFKAAKTRSARNPTGWKYVQQFMSIYKGFRPSPLSLTAVSEGLPLDKVLIAYVIGEAGGLMHTEHQNRDDPKGLIAYCKDSTSTYPESLLNSKMLFGAVSKSVREMLDVISVDNRALDYYNKVLRLPRLVTSGADPMTELSSVHSRSPRMTSGDDVYKLTFMTSSNSPLGTFDFRTLRLIRLNGVEYEFKELQRVAPTVFSPPPVPKSWKDVVGIKLLRSADTHLRAQIAKTPMSQYVDELVEVLGESKYTRVVNKRLQMWLSDVSDTVRQVRKLDQSYVIPTNIKKLNDLSVYYHAMDVEVTDILSSMALVTNREMPTAMAIDGIPAHSQCVVTQLLTHKDLIAESNVMKHCVHGYSSRILAGTSIIFSIVLKSNPIVRSTAEFGFDHNNKMVLRQHRGFLNDDVTNASLNDACSNLLVHLNRPATLNSIRKHVDDMRAKSHEMSRLEAEYSREYEEQRKQLMIERLDRVLRKRSNPPMVKNNDVVKFLSNAILNNYGAHLHETSNPQLQDVIRDGADVTYGLQI
jgi:hypothetical protein